MMRALAFVYGAAAHFAATVTILYAIPFVGNFLVPKTIDSGTAGPPLQAPIINLALLGAFAVQHSVMARQGFKRVWTRIVAQPIERSTYVWFSSALLALLYWQWQPMPAVIWDVDNTIGVGALWTLFGLGWLIFFTSIELIDRQELFGVKQVKAFLHNRAPDPVPFKSPFLYKLVRHPLYLGLLIGFWVTPTMTLGHLLFSIATTGYILIGLQLEERDLVNAFGDEYRDHRQRVPMIVPLTKGKPAADARTVQDTRP